MKILFYSLVIGTVLLSALAIGHWRKSGPVIGFQIPLTDAEVPASSIQIASGDPLVTDGCDDNADCVINPTFGASGGCFGANSSLECVPNADSFPVVHRDITFNTSRIPWTCSCVTVSGYPPSNFTCPDGDFGGPCDYYPEIADEEEEPISPGKP